MKKILLISSLIFSLNLIASEYSCYEQKCHSRPRADDRNCISSEVAGVLQVNENDITLISNQEFLVFPISSKVEHNYPSKMIYKNFYFSDDNSKTKLVTNRGNNFSNISISRQIHASNRADNSRNTNYNCLRD